GVPRVVHTVHGWGFTPGQAPHLHRLYVELERWCARYSDLLVVVADVDREDGLRLGIGTPAQYRTIRSGIEVSAYLDTKVTRTEARSRIGVPGDAFVVGCVGRLSPQKAPHDLLAAFARLACGRPNAHLVLVGDGPLRDDVVASVRRENLADRV